MLIAWPESDNSANHVDFGVAATGGRCMNLRKDSTLHRIGGSASRSVPGRRRRNASLAGVALALTGLLLLAGRLSFPGWTWLASSCPRCCRVKPGHGGKRGSLGAAAAAGTGRAGNGARVEECLTINRTPLQIYYYWRNLENLPSFMHHLESVRVIDDKRSLWKGVTSSEWEVDIVADAPGKLIRWRALDGPDAVSEEAVELRAAPGGRGTEVRVAIRQFTPAGALARAVAKLISMLTARQVKDELKLLKQILETGEPAQVKSFGTTMVPSPWLSLAPKRQRFNGEPRRS
jgi:uncharacterized membrane protein